MRQAQKTAFLFPGQGGQFVGMGKDLYERSEAARNVFETAKKTTGLPIDSLCFEGPEDKLKETLSSQLCVLTVSIAALESLREKAPEVRFAYAAGLSLGEYAALYAAGVLGMEDVFSLVKKRALFMQSSCEKASGTMVSLLGLDEAGASEACRSSGGFCSVANLNCPGQVVVSCEKNIAVRLIELAKEKGAKRCIEIPVAGAFHSAMMKEAAESFSLELKNTALQDEKAREVVFNLTARPLVPGQDDIRDMLARHIVSPVLWEKSVRFMLQQGVDHFIEIGPGKVLSGLLKRIDRNAVCRNIEDAASLEEVWKSL